MSPLRVVVFAAFLLLTNEATLARSPGCGAMEFSQTVLEKFPNAPRACLDVVTRNGEPYGVFKASIVRVSDMGNEIDLRFKLPDGSLSDTRHLETSPDLRVMVGNKPTKVNNLVVGDELTAYVKVNAPVLALAPAEESTPLQFTPILLPAEAPQQTVAAAMPATAGYSSTLALAGGLLLMLASAMWIYRSNRRNR